MGSETAMRKGIKILGKVLSWIIVAIVGLPVAAALLLNVGTVQNFAVRKATELLSRKLETTVSIDRIRLRGFSRLVAEGLYIEDYTGDTMLYAKKLGAAVSKSALLHKKIIIGDVFLDEAKIYLYTPRDGELNIAQLISRLGSDTTKQKSSTRLAFRDLRISDSRFMFRNEGADTLSQGVNFGNMVFDGLDIRSDGLDIDGGTITMDIVSMSFRDISGFTVRNLSTDQLTVGDGLIALNGTRIVTPRSDLSMPVFRMDGGNWEAMADILDSVRFDVRLEHSTLSTRTLAYFVPSLGTDEGLLLRNATVDFGGTINDFKVKLALLVGDPGGRDRTRRRPGQRHGHRQCHIRHRHHPTRIERQRSGQDSGRTPARLAAAADRRDDCPRGKLLPDSQGLRPDDGIRSGTVAACGCGYGNRQRTRRHARRGENGFRRTCHGKRRGCRKSNGERPAGEGHRGYEGTGTCRQGGTLGERQPFRADGRIQRLHL